MALDDIHIGPADTDAAEDLDTQLAKIADQLATLAAAEDSPAGFSALSDPFEPEEVSFDSGSWLLRVLQVQGWLHLDEEIDPAMAEISPETAARRLFNELGLAAPEQCVSQETGTLRLTRTGADALDARLSEAVYFQGQYLQLRESLTRRQATDQWNELWEEEQPSEFPLEPIKARATIWPIQEFADKAKKGKLNLSPSYQRGDVWPTDHSQKLIISILRGIPLPSVILLKPQAQGASGIYEVVDGKQRLTSILRFIGKHPEALRRVKEAHEANPKVGFEALFETNYRKFRRLWTTHCGEPLTARKEAEYYFPFRLPSTTANFEGPLARVQGKYFCEIREVPVAIGPGEETVDEIFQSVSEYKVPLIEYTDAAPRQVHEVFHLYNRQGKHLNAEEIRNALFHELKIMRLLLVASGDNGNITELAPYLVETQHPKLQDMASALNEYRFGTARYRRTKLLSWLVALVLHPSLQEDGTLAVRSTAKHIDEMLRKIADDVKLKRHNALAQDDSLAKLIDDLHNCLEVHSGCVGWEGVFRDDKDGAKWQELQLVASLVGVFLIASVFPNASDLLEERHDALLEFTATHRRPEKTQNKTQWAFIGKVALGLVGVAGLDLSQIDSALTQRYGVSCIPTLQAAALHYRQRQEA